MNSLCLTGVLSIMLGLALGCQATVASSAKKKEGARVNLAAAMRLGEDASRCEYKNRPDRDVEETSTLGAMRPNIRRIYAMVGEGEDRHKTLLCREIDSNLDGIQDVVRTYNDKGESLREVADSNYDGKVDTWITFAHGRIVKVDLDRTGDGQADEYRFYVQGKLSRIQRDTNRDGRPDVWEIYEEGELKRMGWDLDFDGRVDRWDRDEVAERAALEKELQIEEQRKQEEAAKRKAEDAAEAEQSGTKKKPVSGHVSARKR